MPSSMHVLFFIIQFNGSLIPWTSAHLNRLLKTLSSSLYLKARNAELCNGDTPREHREVMPHYSLCREEKSLRHVAMVETFLDDNKPKLHLLNENSHCFKLHRSYSLLFNIVKCWRNFLDWIRKKKKKKLFVLCSSTSQSGEREIRSFLSQSCNDGYKMCKKASCTSAVVIY